MAVLNDVTVRDGNLDLVGGRKIVRLENGWVIAVVYDPSIKRSYFMVNKLDGNGFSQLCYTDYSQTSVAIAAYKNTVYWFGATLSTARIGKFDATNITNTSVVSFKDFSGYNSIQSVGNNIVINNNDIFCSFVGYDIDSYYAFFINGNVSNDNSFILQKIGNQKDINSAEISVDSLGNPIVFLTNNFSGGSGLYELSAYLFAGGTSWTKKNVYSVNGNSLNQYYVSSVYVPKSINGLTNGRIWVSWCSKDVSSSTNYQIKVSYSDDNGLTWNSPQQLTSGNYPMGYSSITSNLANEVFIVFSSADPSVGVMNVRKIKFSNGSWGSISKVTNNTISSAVSAYYLVDYSLNSDNPIFIYKDLQSTKTKVIGNIFIPSSISPPPSNLGEKSNNINILNYIVAKSIEATSISKIEEKVNGVVINTFTNPASLTNRTFDISLSTWQNMKFGNVHTIDILVTDNLNVISTFTYTFKKWVKSGLSLIEWAQAQKDGTDVLNTKRTNLENTIRSMGVTVPSDATFDQLNTSLKGKFVGKRFASGTLSDLQVSSSVAGAVTRTISGLSFTPTSVILTYQGYRNSLTSPVLISHNTTFLSSFPSSTPSRTAYITAISSNGFTVSFGDDLGGGSPDYMYRNIQWVAYE